MEACSQSAITCSKLKTETLQQRVKYFEVNNKDTRRTSPFEPSENTRKPLVFRGIEWGRRSGVFIVNFQHTSNLALVFLLLTLSR